MGIYEVVSFSGWSIQAAHGVDLDAQQVLQARVVRGLGSRLRVGVGVVAGPLGRAHRVLGRARRVARLARLHGARAAARLALAAAPSLQRLQ